MRRCGARHSSVASVRLHGRFLVLYYLHIHSSDHSLSCL